MMKQLKGKVLIGMRAYFIVVLIWLTSCVSLKHNYIGISRRDPALAGNVIQRMKLDSARRCLDDQGDSLLRRILIRQQTRRHLSAFEINQLYANFGAQLNYDRLFGTTLRTGKTTRRKLSFRQRYAAAKLLISAARYDSTYQQNKTIRRALNRGDRGNRIPYNVLQKSRKFLYSPFIRKKLFSGKPTKPDGADSLLLRLPETSFVKWAGYNVCRHNDRIYGLFYNVFPAIGQSLFGEVGERISNRSRQKKFAIQLFTLLKPYDILLSRSPGHLTAKVIPGYYGHASIWLGSETPRSHKPLFRNFLRPDSLKTGIRQKEMAEALRNGVQLSKLIEYADADEYIIIRPRQLSKDQKESIVENTMKQIGKCYDFNFDVQSPDMVNCTELVYLAYDFVDWEVRSILGRYTLIPDDILTTALHQSNQFEIVAIVRDHELMIRPPIEYVTSLLK